LKKKASGVLGNLLKRYYYIEKSQDSYFLRYKDEEKDSTFKGEIDLERIISISQ